MDPMWPVWSVDGPEVPADDQAKCLEASSRQFRRRGRIEGPCQNSGGRGVRTVTLVGTHPVGIEDVPEPYIGANLAETKGRLVVVMPVPRGKLGREGGARLGVGQLEPAERLDKPLDSGGVSRTDELHSSLLPRALTPAR
jgi:hypothetical protein